jgi:hypothetical protein
MNEKIFNLSEHRIGNPNYKGECYDSEDVKEFIKLVMEMLILDDYAIGSPRGEDYYISVLKQYAGDKLI